MKYLFCGIRICFMDDGNHVQAIVDKLKPQHQIQLVGGRGVTISPNFCLNGKRPELNGVFF
jgi:hypothetical protein